MLHARRAVREPECDDDRVFPPATGCVPGKLADAANSLIDQGIDVLTQQPGLPEAGPGSRGSPRHLVHRLHADASSIAGAKWITGGRWVWGPIMTKLVVQALDGTYKPALPARRRRRRRGRPVELRPRMCPRT